MQEQDLQWKHVWGDCRSLDNVMGPVRAPSLTRPLETDPALPGLWRDDSDQKIVASGFCFL